MTTITVESDNEQDLRKIKEIASDNGWQISYSKPSIDILSNREKIATDLIDLLEECAGKGGLKSFGDNPSQWQREQRKDKALEGG
jgi:hypothetical protein